MRKISMKEEALIDNMIFRIRHQVIEFLNGFEPSGINRKGILMVCCILNLRRVFAFKRPQELMYCLRLLVKAGLVREYENGGFRAFVPIEFDKLNYKSQFD
ncbi:MAG: hypothetical protein MUF12_00535 [Sediminibacterium sp.]|nr:hypothetical protein [Sediminibacterium sp.]